MFALNLSFLLDSLLIFWLAFLIDLIFGELPDRFHPTLWMGKTISYFKSKLRSDNKNKEKINGVSLCLSVIAVFVIPVFLIIYSVQYFLGWLPYIIVSAFLLSTTIAIKCMKQYTSPVVDALENDNYDKAKECLPFIVRRDPSGLKRNHIISAAVETIAEGTTDGITSPFFYFALFGVPGAVAFRVINTLDSMVGYKDEDNLFIGWFSAKMDTIANYIPARLTAILMILTSFVLRENWRKSYKILKRDHKNTESPNAGWTISAMAGALNIKLEKPGFYLIGDTADPSLKDIIKSFRILIVTAIFFGVFIVFPLLALIGLIL
jgi:adenosylcobinamide-phosphate synthase